MEEGSPMGMIGPKPLLINYVPESSQHPLYLYFKDRDTEEGGS